MLVVIFNGLEVVYGVRERRLCPSDFFWGCFTRDPQELLIFRSWPLGHVYRACSWDVRLGLKYREGCSKPAM